MGTFDIAKYPQKGRTKPVDVAYGEPVQRRLCERADDVIVSCAFRSTGCRHRPAIGRT